MHRGAFYQFSFRWIYYYGSNKSTGKETGKTHLCSLPLPNINNYTLIFCIKQVQASHADAEKDAVVVPTTMEEYCMKAKPLRPAQDSIEMDDFYDDNC